MRLPEQDSAGPTRRKRQRATHFAQDCRVDRRVCGLQGGISDILIRCEPKVMRLRTGRIDVALGIRDKKLPPCSGVRRHQQRV